MTEAPVQNAPAPTLGGVAGPADQAAPASSRAPLCFVVDGESSIRHFLSLILHGNGIDTEEFADGATFRQAVARRMPNLVFLDIPLDSKDAIESVIALGRRRYPGSIQLMSSRGSAVLEHVKVVCEQHKVKVLPNLKKPFETSTITEIVQELRLGNPPTVAGRAGLDEALKNGWLEFWFQPKIDLRRKQLAGAEVYARARHPQFGIIPPDAFLPGASDSDLVALAEQGLIAALKAGLNISQVGVNLCLSLNMPLDAMNKLPIADIVRSHRPQANNWPGLIIDIAEEQIVTEIKLATEHAQKLAQVNVKLAIDHFGRGFQALAKLKEMPFAEIKLDQPFVTDVATDKVNAPLCRSVIDLAHHFGRVAVAIGIEKAADVLALTSMGCDYGQGYLLGQPMPEARFLSLLRQRAAAHAPQKSPASAAAGRRSA